MAPTIASITRNEDNTDSKVAVLTGGSRGIGYNEDKALVARRVTFAIGDILDEQGQAARYRITHKHEANVGGVIECNRVELMYMAKRGQGIIINTASVAVCPYWVQTDLLTKTVDANPAVSEIIQAFEEARIDGVVKTFLYNVLISRNYPYDHF
ncbi:hypothetical protein BDB00DRAFT_937261 [Zychaea mexicana]|uniref:uncharacterized protein n=1 Tax=Zychaea mexicana TaxID=64656 RepID=UPI0022FEDB4B|nr:uncharacterized protein BDB00DRAFT_937261 [Zychaea mexicana]KAI9495978.1 hypothetical protein BDB00DRAFT_937261 [Zychaea mexicana]